MKTVTPHLKGVTASWGGPHLECSVSSQQHTWKLPQNKRGQKPKSCHRSKLKETSTSPWRWISPCDLCFQKAEQGLVNRNCRDRCCLLLRKCCSRMKQSILGGSRGLSTRDLKTTTDGCFVEKILAASHSRLHIGILLRAF